MVNVCVIGAGNVGTAILSKLCQKENLFVTIYSTRKQLWNDIICYRGMDSKGEWNQVSGFKITDDLKDAVQNADQIFVTLPSFLREKCIDEINDYVMPDTLIAFVPGCGGAEFFCGKLMDKKCRIIGFDRVPAVSRVKEYGKSVEFEWKKTLRLAGLNVNKSDIKVICEILSKEFEIKFTPLDCYLSITLTPANPIMHPVRLYSMFKDKQKDSVLDRNILFYGEWDDDTSGYLFQCDEELQRLCDVIGVGDVISLKKHYEANTPEQMTQKMHSIVAFKKVQSPIKQDENGSLKIDFDSRYFTEDFHYGLFIIKALADIFDVETKMIDTIIAWYINLTGESNDYYNLLKDKGIETENDVYNLYGLSER